MSLAAFGSSDSREASKIKARQAREAERRARLLDARSRTMSCDKAALDQQRRARRAKAKAERDEERRLVQQNSDWNRQIAMFEAAQMDDERKKQMALAMEWKKQQLLRSKRNDTWDLNDPDRLKNDKPARVGENDPRLGPASMQVFAGENLNQEERLRAEQAELSAYLERQIAEKRQREAQEREDDRRFGQGQVALCNAVSQAEYEEMVREQRSREDLANQNRAIANRNRRNRAAQKAADDALSKLEMEYQRKNKMLRDDSSQGSSALGDHRVRRDHYKGMDPAARRQIFEDQARQREELAARRARQRADDLEYDRNQNAIVGMLTQMEIQSATDKKQAELDYQAQLQLQKAQNSKARKAAKMSSEVDISDEYWKKSFQAGSR